MCTDNSAGANRAKRCSAFVPFKPPRHCVISGASDTTDNHATKADIEELEKLFADTKDDITKRDHNK
jgi:hypothetical protein